jgi:Holliday junction resolvase
MSLYRNIRRSRRRGKYAVRQLGKQINTFPNWSARMTPASGAGPISEVNVYPDLEAFNNALGIYIAFEVKSTKGDRVYVRNKLRRRKDGTLPHYSELVQVRKLFESMNVVGCYPRRWAVLACKFKKTWRFMILHKWHLRLPFIGVTKKTKKTFKTLKSLIQYIENDTRVWFPLETDFVKLILERMPKTEGFLKKELFA